MLDRCYTDCHLFQICLASVDYFFSTEDTDKHGFLFRVFCVFCGFLFHTEGHGCELTKTITITITFTGGRVVSASGRVNSNCRQCNSNCHKNISLKRLLGNCWQLLFKKRVASPLAAQRLNCCDIFPRRTRINTDFCSVYSVSSVDYLFHTEDTDGHGGGLTKTITFNGGRAVSASCLSP